MSTPIKPDESKLVSALARGITILNCFSPVQYELSAKDIAEKTGLPKPTLFRLLETLCEFELIRYSERLSKYVPGVGLLNLSAPVLQRMTIRQLARPLMQELADYISGQVQLVMATRDKMCYIEIAQGKNSKIYRPEAGVRMSISKTSTGRAYISSIPVQFQQEYMEDLERKYPGQRAWFEERLADAKKDLEQLGFCRGHRDFNREIDAIAVPLKKPIDNEYWMFAASVPVYSPESKRIDDDIAPRLITLVRTIESSLGNPNYAN
ncbi:IclR family transcriptional regulator [Advenella sp. RU8]|uniref:IclR family transcriptional regulator n=1 Tax=Advenella sp. RU8 TaxID=3399575 RepID=UPI003AAE8B7F